MEKYKSETRWRRKRKKKSEYGPALNVREYHFVPVCADTDTSPRRQRREKKKRSKGIEG